MYSKLTPFFSSSIIYINISIYTIIYTLIYSLILFSSPVFTQKKCPYINISTFTFPSSEPNIHTNFQYKNNTFFSNILKNEKNEKINFFESEIYSNCTFVVQNFAKKNHPKSHTGRIYDDLGILRRFLRVKNDENFGVEISVFLRVSGGKGEVKVEEGKEKEGKEKGRKIREKKGKKSENEFRENKNEYRKSLYIEGKSEYIFDYEYVCPNIDKNDYKKLSKEENRYFKLGITLKFSPAEEKNEKNEICAKDILSDSKLNVNSNSYRNPLVVEMELFKICNVNSPQRSSEDIDICHIFIIIISLLILLSSSSPSLYSEIENKTLKKHPEIRKPQNLLLLTITIFVFWLIAELFGFLHFCACVVSLIVCSLSLALVFDTAMQKLSVRRGTCLVERSFEFAYFGSLKMEEVGCLIAGFMVYVAFVFSQSAILENFLAFSVCYVFLRIFKFTSFLFILFVCWFFWMFEFFLFVFKFEEFKLDEIRGIFVRQNSYDFPIFIMAYQMANEPLVVKEYYTLNIGEIIVCGIFINYLFRFDKKIKLHSMIFYMTGLIIFTLSVTLRSVVITFFSFQLPLILICIPPLTMISLLMAYRRSLLNEILEGFQENVYDENELEGKRLDSFANSYLRESLYSEESGTVYSLNKKYTVDGKSSQFNKSKFKKPTYGT